MADHHTNESWPAGTTIEHAFTGLTIDATWARVALVVRRDPNDAGIPYVLHVVASDPADPADGLVTVEKQAVADLDGITAADATLAVSQGAGTVTLTLSAAASALLVPRRWLSWTLSQLAGGAVSILDSGDSLAIDPPPEG